MSSCAPSHSPSIFLASPFPSWRAPESLCLYLAVKQMMAAPPGALGIRPAGGSGLTIDQKKKLLWGGKKAAPAEASPVVVNPSLGALFRWPMQPNRSVCLFASYLHHPLLASSCSPVSRSQRHRLLTTIVHTRPTSTPTRQSSVPVNHTRHNNSFLLATHRCVSHCKWPLQMEGQAIACHHPGFDWKPMHGLTGYCLATLPFSEPLRGKGLWCLAGSAGRRQLQQVGDCPLCL